MIKKITFSMAIFFAMSLSWAQTGSPNVIIVLTDDLSTYETTPQSMPLMFSNLANVGVELANFNIPQSLCCPSRSSFLRGQSAHNMGMHSNLTEYNPEVNRVYFGGAPWFRFNGLDQDTIATRIKATTNYMTAWSGAKYLNDWPKKLVSYTDTSVTFTPIPDIVYRPPGWDYWYGAVVGSANGYNNKFNRNGVIDPQGTNATKYNTDLVFNEAKTIINLATAQNKPLFLHITTNAPHTPFPPPTRHASCVNTVQQIPQTTSFNEANVADKAPPLRRAKLTTGQKNAFNVDYTRRLCSLKAIDEGIAALVAHLALVPGRLENTYIIFTSDNGFVLGQHRYYGKSIPYEESTRVPFFVRGPGVPSTGTPDSRKVATPVTITDLTATVMDIVGATPAPFMEGRSAKAGFLEPASFDATGNTKKMFLLEGLTSAKPVSAGGSGECWIPPAPQAGATSTYISEYDRARRNFWGLKTLRYTYIKWCSADGSNHRELYDNVTDPGQNSSLLEQVPYVDAGVTMNWSVATGQLPAVVNPVFLNELDARINDLKTCTGQACRAFEDMDLVNTPY